MAARLKEHYQTEVRKKLQDEFQIKNPMAVPKIEKVVLNMGMGEAISNAKILDTAVDELQGIQSTSDISREEMESKLSVASGKDTNDPFSEDSPFDFSNG